MKILIVNNYYPPAKYGWGYTQLCEEVVDGLADKDHQIAVLTSKCIHGQEIPRPYPVHRALNLDPDWNKRIPAPIQFFWGRLQREKKAVKILNSLLEEFNPDAVFIWHGIGLPRRLFAIAEKARPTVYYLAGYMPELPDEYFAYWQTRPTRMLGRISKGLLSRHALKMLAREGKPIELMYSHVICVSHYLRQRLVEQGLIPETAVVIHNGVDLSTFNPSLYKKKNLNLDILSMLIAGRVVPDKGIHTVLDALEKLGDDARHFHLDILGDGPQDYIDMLKKKAEAIGRGNWIRFLSPVPRNKMPQMLSQHDILLLPSEYAEPIARSMQEAMAMGLLVIGTTTGGSGELLVHDETGLVFAAGDSQSLAEQLKRLISGDIIIENLACVGQKRVEDSFTIALTIDMIEQFLLRLLAQ